MAVVIKQRQGFKPSAATLYSNINPVQPGSTVGNFYRLSRLVLVPLFNFVCVCVFLCVDFVSR